MVAEPQPGTAQALAQKASVYAQSVEPMLAKRPEKARVSQVQWPDPDDLHLTAHEAAAQEPAAADLAPEPNTVAATVETSPKTQPQNIPPPRPELPAATATAPATSDTLAQRFAQRVKDFPQDISAHVDYQLLKFLQEEPVPLIPVLTPLPEEDRELVTALMDSLSNLRTTLRSDDNVLFGRKIRPLLDLAERLRGRAELSIPTVALCTSVTHFGIYEPFEKNRFVAGKAHDVVVYCEVENFSSQLNGQKMWETRLNQEIVLYTESQGLPVWSDQKKTYVDVSHSRRHDFFTAPIIRLPANLTIGRYLLKVSVEDQQVKRIAENTIPIEIVAQ